VVTAADWAAELSAGPDPGLVERVLRLATAPWVHPERLRGVVEALLDQPSVAIDDVITGLEAEGDARRRPLPEPAEVREVALTLLRHGARMAIVGQPGYPPRLNDAWPELGAPLWLFLRAPDGRVPAAPAVAVVGSRHPTVDGVETAEALGRLLARHGVTVVSGMARGIDQAAHRGALRAGGATVAVLGTGFGVDYPAGDEAVREAIAAAGALVTELPPGLGPKPRHFLWRNRVISGLADVTVVVQGRVRSGALHTARLAAAQGREVMAVPGSVNDPASRAPLDLIRDGATPLTRLGDVLEVIGLAGAGAGAGAEAGAEGGSTAPVPSTGHRPISVAARLSAEAGSLLTLIGTVPAAPGALARAADRPVTAILSAVAELETAGMVRTTPRGPVLTHAAPTELRSQ
jgi:DNA processing protein